MKYSWQKMHAPFLLPSMVDALMISSISGTLNPFSASAILRRRHLHCLSEKYWPSSILLFWRLWKVSQIPMVSKKNVQTQSLMLSHDNWNTFPKFHSNGHSASPSQYTKGSKIERQEVSRKQSPLKKWSSLSLERWRLLSVGNAKALSVRCGD